MRRNLHYVTLVLFLLAFLWDLVLWGAVPDLPEVGPAIEYSASNEAFLGSLYIALGQALDGFLPALAGFGASIMSGAVGEGFARMVEAPNLAMEIILGPSFNSLHAWVKLLYWASPLLLVTFLILWATRPKKVSLARHR
jgi:hypothetical protein